MNDKTLYRPRTAWILGFLSFFVFWLVALVASATTAAEPLRVAFTVGDISGAAGGALRWYTLTTLLLAIAAVGYWVIWPIGTRTFGRPLHRGWTVLFGSVWGVSEAVLYVTIWSLLRELISTDWLVVLASFLVVSAFTGSWHQFFWDIRVAPIHNIPEWNLRKVLFVHTPLLVLAMVILTMYEGGLTVVLALVIALVGSTVKMHFPAPTDSPTNLDGSPAT